MHAKTWAIADDDADPEQYNAIDYENVLADPILRLHTRIWEVEKGDGVVCCSGERVVLDDTERTIMAARTDHGTDTDVSQAAAETDIILRMSLDLHEVQRELQPSDLRPLRSHRYPR